MNIEKDSALEISDFLVQQINFYQKEDRSGENPLYCRYAVKVVEPVIHILCAERDAGSNFPVFGDMFNKSSCFGLQGSRGTLSMDYFLDCLEIRHVLEIAANPHDCRKIPEYVPYNYGSVFLGSEEKQMFDKCSRKCLRTGQFVEEFDSVEQRQNWSRLTSKAWKLARMELEAGRWQNAAITEHDIAFALAPEAVKKLGNVLREIFVARRLENIDLHNGEWDFQIAEYRRIERFFTPLHQFAEAAKAK